MAYQNEQTIGPLVASLSLLGPDIGLALHDNGPAAGTLDVARGEAARAGVAFRGERCASGNCGFGAGCNALARTSDADDLLFLNPDARILSWPDGLTARTGILGATVLGQDGRSLHTMGR
ncbi:MAG: hypothetical protein JOY78_08795, partial [Pseudonocardia sp.]|nr:hypothetical protein [Pseudonocardia sp.]